MIGHLAQGRPRARPVTRLALRLLSREWRAGELGILVAALIIAVGSMTAVGLFTDRLDRAMSRQAAELLAADLVLTSAEPVAPARLSEAIAAGLATAQTLSFRTVVVRADEFQLVEAKAVSDNYPLRGQLRVTDRPFGPEAAASGTPRPGELWIDPKLATALDLHIGSTLDLGQKRFEVTHLLSYEPDRAGDLFSIAPRVLLNLDDVAATGLVQPGSRVNRRLLLAGSHGQIAGYRDRIGPRLGPGERFQGIEDARPEIRIALERASQFLGLASLAAVLLAGVSVALSAQRYARRHRDTAALLRCFGCRRNDVVRLFFMQLLGLGVAAGCVGVALGVGAQAVLVELLSGLFIGGLPAPSLQAALLGLGLGLVVLLGFGLPPLIGLGRVPPGRVLRRDDDGLSTADALVYVGSLTASVLLVLWNAADLKLAGYVLGGAGVGLVVLGLAALGLVRSLRGLRSRVGVAWRFGLANISRHGRASALQMMSFGLGIMALLLLAVVRGDLIDAWQKNLPPDTPNYFLVNIPTDEAPRVEQQLRENGVIQAATYPMIRGRLVGINGRKIAPEDYPEGRPRRLVSREFNLSFARELPNRNTISAGQWWDPESDPDEFSFEHGIAATLGVKVGDQVEFQVAGRTVSARVSSLRAVKWESFDVNFFVVGTPALLTSYPATFISSFYLEPSSRGLLAAIVKDHPSVTVIDVDALLSKVRLLMDQATRGVEFVFLFTLVAGLSVLVATVHATLDVRRLESALVRTLGGSRARVWHGLLAEFLTLGLLAGILAALGATVVGNLLATQLFGLPYSFNPWIWLLGVPAGALGIGITGVLGTRRVVTHPPMETLRTPNF